MSATASTNLGSPAGLTVTALVGPAHVNDYVTIFAVCNAGNLWGKTFYLTQWLPWVKIGVGAPPPGLSLTGNNGGNGTYSAGGSCWVFCLGKDGLVWTALGANGAWMWVAAPGAPTGIKIAKILGTTSPLTVWANGVDGSLWSSTWNGAVWVWLRQTVVPPVFFANPTLGWDHTATSINWSGVGMLFGQIGIDIVAAVAICVSGEGSAGDLPVQKLDTDATSNKVYSSINIVFTMVGGGVTATVNGV